MYINDFSIMASYIIIIWCCMCGYDKNMCINKNPHIYKRARYYSCNVESIKFLLIDCLILICYNLSSC
jgi:hypothetical protein